LHRYNGGAKFYNLWTKLLCENGHEACIATQDGTYEPWLVNQQPVVSYEQVQQMEAPKIATGWLPTPGLEELAQGPFYYFDAELHWTLAFRAILDQYLKRDLIAAIATHSRYIQAWYMATYGITPLLIRQWSDQAVFYPGRRRVGSIGCMVDDPGSEAVYQALVAAFPDVEMITGDEAQVAEALRKVDVFAGINPGKDALWGEGLPCTQYEAMHSGCVVVAFDVFGNREYILDGYSGLLVERGDHEGLVTAIASLLADPEGKKRLRKNSLNIVRSLFSDRDKIALFKRWLNL
jgi:hypothetical protein